MKIYNETKTIELNENEIDRSKGYLVADKLLVAHHDAEPFVPGKTAAEIAADLTAKGEEVIGINNKFYCVIATYENGGRDVEQIKDVPDTPAKEAWDEYEDILVYEPYTADELKERQLQQLRIQRATECFPYINRGALWYDTLTESQRKDLKAWYTAWLNVTDTLIVPKKPKWLK